MSDIALDERLTVYAANFSANKIEVINIANRAVLSPLLVPLPPSSGNIARLSISSRGRVPGGFRRAGGGYTIFDLVTNARQTLRFPPVLSVALEASGRP